MKLRVFIFTILFWVWYPLTSMAQRNYAPNSVLATGNWYKIAVTKQGVYKVDLSLLNALVPGISGQPSASIRLFGNGGAMLDENNAVPRPDDLVENPVEMVDGGDGQFNGSDYFLFYAPGPQRWVADSSGQSFHHQKNRYTDTVYYYINFSGTGRRLPVQTVTGTPTVSVTSYDERYFYENDLVNFLNSGKEWYGEEFNNNLGGSNSRSFSVNWPGLIFTSPVKLVTNLAARTVGAASSFVTSINAASQSPVTMPAVSGYFLDSYATGVSQTITINPASNKLDIGFAFLPGVSGAQGWLNWFELFGRRALSVTAGSQLLFRDWQSVAANAIARFTLNNGGGSYAVWDVTDPLQPVKMTVSNSSTQTSFQNDASRLREYVAFANADLLKPIAIGKQANQNLHNSTVADLLIVTHSSLLTEAQRLAQFHVQHDAYKTVVVTTDQVFTEFSGGVPDPTAIRDFVKMYFDKASNVTDRPKYLLLFGTASYDYRNRVAGNKNLVPGYESVNSLDPLNTYTSDDFFGMLQDVDDINRNDPNTLVDIGIGRIPARNLTEAQTIVDKIIRYHAKESLGAWRNNTVFIADDQDQNLHLTDAEIISSDAAATNDLFNQSKIYLDAYPVVSNSSGARYPAVNDAIVNQVFTGNLMVNYSGHGSYLRLADEAILTQEELNRFNNPDKLPLFITASCDFAPHDDPAKNSLGAGILTGNQNGAIALLTTTRLVFAYSNRLINDNYLKIALKPGANGKYLSLGESVRQAKNMTSVNSGDFLNNRKFTLLGDPAMQLAFPALRVNIDSVNGRPVSGSDTLRALEKYSFSGQVTDASGNTVSNFNGVLHTTVYDKIQTVKTLGNDPSSPVTGFNVQSSVLYKGSATISNGRFRFSFIVPKDINFQPGNGKISLYADNGQTDANGVNRSFSIVAANNGGLADNSGPEIRPFLNDTLFQNGGLTNENPVLLANLFDSSGISTSGNSIGHDITAVIDGEERNIQILNDFYTASRDSYQSGNIRFQLPTLAEGPHSIRIKAWDVANHSGEARLDFIVVKQKWLTIKNVRNYPNPFQSATIFAFEHNQPNTSLEVTINVYTSSGAMVRQIRQTVNTGGTRNCEIKWNGDNQSGAKLAKGIYIYKVIVAASGSQTESSGQLLLF